MTLWNLSSESGILGNEKSVPRTREYLTRNESLTVGSGYSVKASLSGFASFPVVFKILVGVRIFGRELQGTVRAHKSMDENVFVKFCFPLKVLRTDWAVQLLGAGAIR